MDPLDDDTLRELARLRTAERIRPPRIEPGPGQESVWDYPRPPRVEPERRRLRVEHGDVRLAESRRALRVLETSSPPTLYVPPADVRTDLLEPTGEAPLCEWKGRATSWRLRGASDARAIAWSYASPFPPFEMLTSYLAFYPARVGGCFLDDERVRAQPGGYYGGWITNEITGPFKGDPGTEGW